MRGLAWAGILAAPVAAAQPVGTGVGPSWSCSMDLVGPVRSIASAGDALPFFQADLAIQRWALRDLAWRVGYGVVEDRWEELRDVLVVLDSVTYEQELVVARERGHTLRAGAQVQHRDRTVAPLAGVALLFGLERQEALRTGAGLRPDTVPCTDCVLAPIPGYVSLLDGDRRDAWGALGLEVAVGASARLGGRMELELRLPFQLRWRFMLDSAVGGTAPVVEEWAQPWRAGIGFPALFIHYRW